MATNILHLLFGIFFFSMMAASDGADDGVMGVIRTNGRIRRRLEQKAVAAPSSSYCVVAESGKKKEAALQEALDWACGISGGAVDCSAIREGGSCFLPNTLHAHASYAFDYYYVLHGAASASCDFGGLAITSASNPSNGSCIYPSLLSGSFSDSPVDDSSSPGPSSPSSHGGPTNILGLPHACILMLVALLQIAFP